MPLDEEEEEEEEEDDDVENENGDVYKHLPLYSCAYVSFGRVVQFEDAMRTVGTLRSRSTSGMLFCRKAACLI